MQHVQQQSAREMAAHEDRMKQLTEPENRPPTKAVSSVASQTEQGHFHDDGTFHAQPHETPVEVSEVSEVSADVLAAPVVAQPADTEIDAATLELAERRLKDPEISKAWVEWSEKGSELAEKYSQASKEVIAVGPQTDEDVERYKNDPEWQRRFREAFAKMGEIHTIMIEHEKKNPLFQ